MNVVIYLLTAPTVAVPKSLHGSAKSLVDCSEVGEDGIDVRDFESPILKVSKSIFYNWAPIHTPAEPEAQRSW